MDPPIQPHLLVQLAAEAIRTFLSQQRVIEPAADLLERVPEAQERAGAFVCLKREAQLRGCIGTIEPAHPSLAVEIIRNAIGAAVRDSRFPPVEPTELEHLVISVDVIGPTELVWSWADLDPKRFGVVVSAGFRQGVLLPDIEGVTTVEDQIAIAREKAGLGPEDPIELRRFQVRRLF